MSEISGFLFREKESTAQAKKEAEGIAYLREKLDWKRPAQVLAVYNNAVDREVFETPVGLSFLKELRDYLLSVDQIPRDNIRPIPVPEHTPVRMAAAPSRREEPREESAPAEDGRARGRLAVSLFFNLVLALAVIGMVLITTLSRGNVNILNYENELIDRYEEWEQELSQREQAVAQRERELGL